VGSEDALQAKARQLLDLVPFGAGRVVSALWTEPVDAVLMCVQNPALAMQLDQFLEVLARDQSTP